MHSSKRKTTRRTIAYAMMVFLFIVLLWMIVPGDLGDNETELAKVMVGACCLALSAFIAEQGASDHSERKTRGGDGHSN